MVKKIVVSDYDYPEGKCPGLPNTTVEVEDEWKLKIARILVAKEQCKRAAIEALSKLTPELCDRDLPAFEPDPYDSNMLVSPKKISFREGVPKPTRKRSSRKRLKKRKSKRGKRKTSKKSRPQWTLYTILETPEEDTRTETPEEPSELAISEKEMVGHGEREHHIVADLQGVQEADQTASCPHVEKRGTHVSSEERPTKKIGIPAEDFRENEIKFMTSESDYGLVLTLLLPSPAIPSIRSLS
uniref:Uncharacterized protein n=1 Tax=Lotharella globosa TaxID=91324 RepID=A0A7S4DTS2_9EUKA|mmetsp:Transcript_13352/g.27052  ORF Transcript_13352/g.27052 Transcript_13352/m.27052 type:complete len:242 (+) Transcript_13352:81-806(+)